MPDSGASLSLLTRGHIARLFVSIVSAYSSQITMTRPKNAQPAGLAPSSPSSQLPARLTVPPLPPRIHRRLLASATDDGILIRPGESKDPAVLVRWGLRGKVESRDNDEDEATDDEVELGGVLGIVRLWDCELLL